MTDVYSASDLEAGLVRMVAALGLLFGDIFSGSLFDWAAPKGRVWFSIATLIVGCGPRDEAPNPHPHPSLTVAVAVAVCLSRA